MIALSCTNPPNTAPALIDPSVTVAAVIAAYPGFPVYILSNPDQAGSTGDGMGYPYDLSGKEWKAACKIAADAGAELWPRIGGCETHDLPARDGPIATLMDKLRPSKVVLCDYASGQDAMDESNRYQSAIHENGQVFAAEANGKRPYIWAAANTWIVGEWFRWSLAASIPGAVSAWNSRSWDLPEWLSKNAETKAIVEVTSIERHAVGFVDGVADWPAAKVDLAKRFHAIDPKRVVVSVRPSGLSAAQVQELRGLNA